ncbi:MAG TPA: hypothetical protein VGH81_03165 [Rudaea sp.]
MRAWIMLISSALLVGHAAPGAAQAPNPLQQLPQPADEGLQESAAGHGDISIAYLNSYVNGFWLDSKTKIPNGAVRSRGVELDFDYNVADAWSVHVGIPFLSNRYQGSAPHCPTTTPPQCANIPALDPQHPESQFIDDGRYHSTWQDFTLGAAWHTHLNDYYITPSVTATIPSHDYVFFDNAAVGQRLHQLLVAVTLAHQFEFSNLYYKLGYGYAFSEHVLGQDTGYQRFDGELGYFINERWSVRAFVSGRIGNGYSAYNLEPLTDGHTDEYWYHHDQISEHTYFGAGLGLDYDIGNRYTLSAGIQREFFGETVFDFKYALEGRLTKQF